MRLAVLALCALLATPARAEDASEWNHFEVGAFDLLYNGLVSKLGGDLRALALARTSCTPRSDDTSNADCFYMNDLLRFFVYADEDGTPAQINITIRLDETPDRLTTMISLVVAALDPAFSPEEAGRHLGGLVKRGLGENEFEVTLRTTRYEVALDERAQTFRIGLRNAGMGG